MPLRDRLHYINNQNYIKKSFGYFQLWVRNTQDKIRRGVQGGFQGGEKAERKVLSPGGLTHFKRVLRNPIVLPMIDT